MANLHKGFKRVVLLISLIFSGISFYAVLINFETHESTGRTYELSQFNRYCDSLFFANDALIDEQGKTFSLAKVKKRFPQIDTLMFKLRYTTSPDSISDSTLWEKAKNSKSIPLIEPKLKYSTYYILGIRIFSLLVPFCSVWLIWFIVVWIIRGFTGVFP